MWSTLTRGLAIALIACSLTVQVSGGAIYRFNEGSGTTAIDSSGAGNDGAIVGATYVAGVSGTALHFTAGAGQSRVTIPQSVFSGFTNSFYVEAFVRPDAYSPSGLPGCQTEIVRKRAPSGTDWGIAVVNTGQLRCGGGVAALPYADGGNVPLNVWSKVACGYDGTTLRLWVNEVEVASLSHQTAQIDWNTDYNRTEIGNNTFDFGVNCGDYGFKGAIDEVVIRPSIFLSGDVNGDGVVTVGDVFYLVNNLFTSGPAPIGPGDVNGDTQVTVGDVFYLVNFLFTGGPAPR